MQRLIRSLAFANCLIVFAAISTIAASSQPAAAAAAPVTIASFVGKLPGTDAYISVVSRGSTVEAYLCDSKGIAVWLKGKQRGNAFSAANASNDVTLSATARASALQGSVTLNGSRITFSLARAASPAGLYETFVAATPTRDVLRVGWVVLADGSQRGAGKVGTTIVPVAALDPIALAVDVEGNGTLVPIVSMGSEPVAFKTSKKTKQNTPQKICADLLSFYNSAIKEATNPGNANSVRVEAIGRAEIMLNAGKEAGCAWAGGGTVGTGEAT